MLEKETDIPKGAFRPKRDGGYHIAQCQAFGMSRREGKTVAMLKEDHWCPTALMAYGMVRSRIPWQSRENLLKLRGWKIYRRGYSASKERHFYAGCRSGLFESRATQGNAPADDVCGGAAQVSTHLFLPSCAHCVVDPMKTGKYCVVLPDPGEYQRALTLEEEMIFAVPQEKMPGLMAGLKRGGKCIPIGINTCPCIRILSSRNFIRICLKAGDWIQNRDPHPGSMLSWR